MSVIHRPRVSKSIGNYDPSIFPQISTTDAAIISTLPFNPYYVCRYQTEQALQRSARRWVWFDEARKINPTLGTLAYLPFEIRQRVWEMVLQCADTLSADGLWEYDCRSGAPFNLSAYYFGFGRRPFEHQIVGLRLVSLSVRTEFDDIFLSKRTFRFNSPESLDAFINGLTSYQLARLRSFEIGLTVCLTNSMEIWLDSMTRLPSGLQEVHFRIYRARNGWFGERRIFHGVDYGCEIGQEEFDLLDALVKRAIQRASKARVTICGAAKEHPLSTRCQIAVDAIVAKNRQQTPPS